MTFEEILATRNARQDNFRSRLFKVFSEDVVRFWAKGDAPYRAIQLLREQFEMVPAKVAKATKN